MYAQAVEYLVSNHNLYRKLFNQFIVAQDHMGHSPTTLIDNFTTWLQQNHRCRLSKDASNAWRAEDAILYSSDLLFQTEEDYLLCLLKT